MATIKRHILRVEEDVEKVELSCIVGGNVMGTTIVKNSLALSYKFKHTHTI